jgi:hypothetical protein
LKSLSWLTAPLFPFWLSTRKTSQKNIYNNDRKIGSMVYTVVQLWLYSVRNKPFAPVQQWIKNEIQVKPKSKKKEKQFFW